MRTYKITGHRPVEGAGPGEELEHEFTVDEEAGHIAARRLAIVPRAYRVIGPHSVHGTEPGGNFLAALTIGQEQSLVEAGHIERAPMTADRKKEAAKESKAEAKDKTNPEG